jgi:predicted AAA+ superfamily ATPase
MGDYYRIPADNRDLLLDGYLNTGKVVVITGVRRCGKSSLLFLIKEALQLSESEYCYCNFDDERITAYPTLLNDIYTLHLEMYRTDPVFFFDEIQEVAGWEKFVNRMYEQCRKVFITGSNATMLSSEISSSLTGRNKVLELFPFSFSEYLRMQAFSIPKGTLIVYEDTNYPVELPEGVSVIQAFNWFLTKEN